MASYRDKINQAKMETESGKIIFCIELMSRYRDLRPKYSESVNIFEDDKYNYYVRENGLIWEVVRYDEFGESFYKVIPRYADYETMVDVLDAQYWCCL